MDLQTAICVTDGVACSKLSSRVASLALKKLKEFFQSSETWQYLVFSLMPPAFCQGIATACESKLVLKNRVYLTYVVTGRE